MRTVFITGATAGIGRAIARKFAREGHNLIISGRRVERLNELADKLTTDYKVDILPLHFDVRSKEEAQKAVESLEGKWKQIDILINNAGLAVGMEPIQEGNIDDWERMIDTNIKGLLYISRAVAPQMVSRKAGHIINVGSTAGRETYPKGNVYCATKHAVDSLSKAMRIDMLPYGIKVTQVRPGIVETEFSLVRFKGDEKKANDAYKGFKALEAKDVAEVTFYCTTLPEHVNVNDIEVTATAQANSFFKKV